MNISIVLKIFNTPLVLRLSCDLQRSIQSPLGQPTSASSSHLALLCFALLCLLQLAGIFKVCWLELSKALLGHVSRPHVTDTPQHQVPGHVYFRDDQIFFANPFTITWEGFKKNYGKFPPH